jgi:hypothetical protein
MFLNWKVSLPTLLHQLAGYWLAMAISSGIRAGIALGLGDSTYFRLMRLLCGKAGGSCFLAVGFPALL